MLAACDNIQKRYNISPKQLRNWLVTLFIMSHTCDKLFNSVDPNKSKSKQLANSVRGLFVAIYRCAQAVQHFKAPLRGKPFNDSLGMTSITQHIWQPTIWQPILLHSASRPACPLAPNSCLHVFSLCCWEQPAVQNQASQCFQSNRCDIRFQHRAGFWELLKSPQFYG